LNGQPFAEGEPGSYLTLDRVWRDSDCISLTLPPTFCLTRYTGVDQVTGPAGAGTDRCALEYGPLLLALVGPQDDAYRQPGGQPCARLPLASEELISALEPVAGHPLRFTVAGDVEHYYEPYYRIDRETFTCFPVLAA
jgi:DUF1680 family protein